MEDARQVFDKMSDRDAVAWNAMIADYAQNGHGDQAVGLFHQMQLVGAALNPITMVSMLQDCAHLRALQQGMSMHGYMIRRVLESDVFVGNSLVAMYAKCRYIEIARQLFNRMPTRNVVSQNVMIAGYTQNGLADEALELFHQI